MRQFLFLSLALLALPVSAHEYVFRPVKIELRIESHLVRAHIESDAAYWIDEILHVPFQSPLPATNWPKDEQKTARTYIESAFRLAMDGVPLAPSIFECRYAEEPFAPSSSHVLFDIEYPIASVGRELSGRSAFFSEYLVEKSRRKQPPDNDGVFMTRLKIVGGKTVELDIPVEHPEFKVALDGLTVSAAQKAKERVGAIAYRLASSALFWIALGIGVYAVRQRFFARGES